MPATSKVQRRFMGMCEHDPQHAKGKCPSVAVAKEFSSTPEAGLPMRKRAKRSKSSRHGVAI